MGRKNSVFVFDWRKYPTCWPKVSRRIRELAGGTCEWCGKPCSLRKLSVHHIGVPYANGTPSSKHDKHDIRRENLAALCVVCHQQADHQARSKDGEHER